METNKSLPHFAAASRVGWRWANGWLAFERSSAVGFDVPPRRSTSRPRRVCRQVGATRTLGNRLTPGPRLTTMGPGPSAAAERTLGEQTTNAISPARLSIAMGQLLRWSRGSEFRSWFRFVQSGGNVPQRHQRRGCQCLYERHCNPGCAFSNSHRLERGVHQYVDCRSRHARVAETGAFERPIQRLLQWRWNQLDAGWKARPP